MAQWTQGIEFLDALASLDLKLSVTESVSDLPFFKYSVNQVMKVIQLIQDNQDDQDNHDN